MLYIIQTALQLGCVYSFVALALFSSYRILDIADLTTDGCFVLGMAVSVSCCAGGHPFAGVILGMIAGGCAGCVTAILQTRLGVPSILAGIVTNTGLYTINLMAMGWSSNISLLKNETIFSLFKKTNIGGAWNAIILVGMIALCAMVLMKWFLSTRLGLSIRATGDNRDMVFASSINPRFTILVGLVVANMFTGLSGALAGQLQKKCRYQCGKRYCDNWPCNADHWGNIDPGKKIHWQKYLCVSCGKYCVSLYLCICFTDTYYSCRRFEADDSHHCCFGNCGSIYQRES